MLGMGKLILDLLSDTHNRHEEFKCAGGDILLHSGDISSRGGEYEILNFINWLEKQRYDHKVWIPGNHDWGLERHFSYWKNECDNRGIHLLNDSGVILKGPVWNEYEIPVWGSPVQPWFHSWAYNRARTPETATEKHPWIKPHWDMIPEGTEILLTHGPPAGILDEVTQVNGDSYNPPEHAGCEELYKRIQELKIKLHVFGHIHEGRGFVYERETTYVNASSLDRMYMPADRKPIRVIREIFQDGSIGYLV